MIKDFLQHAQALESRIIAWRREIHQYPELGFQEHHTAALIADELRSLRLQVQEKVGRTGVVGRLGIGRPAIGIRADMDALPIEEGNEVPYRSTRPGIMHACGHDAHIAIALATAHLLAKAPARPAGEIRFLFQPSEEKWDRDGISGASAMLQDGALDGLDAVLALHVMSDIPAGKVQITPGYALAASDVFHATIIGAGCHGAMPHLGIDPIFITAQVINAIHGIRSRRINPVRQAVISIGTIEAGHAPNVIPHEVTLRGSMRSFEEDIRQQLFQELERALSLSRTWGGDYRLSVSRGYPALYNNPILAAMAHDVVLTLLGKDGIQPAEPKMGSEDFSLMARMVPGLMFMLGVQREGENRPHHSPYFDLDESALPIGAAVLAACTFKFLEDPPISIA